MLFNRVVTVFSLEVAIQVVTDHQFLILLLFLRLFQLQVIEGEELRRLSENNCIRLHSIDPSRGLIYDRNGRLLVDNRPAFDLSVVLKDARPVDLTIGKLARRADRL